LARPDPEVKDLEETVKTIVSFQLSKDQQASNFEQEIAYISELIPKCYKIYREEQQVGIFLFFVCVYIVIFRNIFIIKTFTLYGIFIGF
jgi:hypothetical protein